jgi:Nif-specific regulatory protein
MPPAAAPVSALTADALPPVSAPAPGTRKSLAEVEREQIEAALLRHGWVQARAARELGLTQRQIGYKIKKFNLRRPDFARWK